MYQAVGDPDRTVSGARTLYAVKTWRGLVALAVVMVLAACGGTAEPRWHTPAAGAVTPSVLPSATPASEITLAFAGDVHFTERTLKLLDHPETAFGPMAEQLRDADFAMVNLETAVTSRGTPQPKTYHFRAPTSAYTALRSAGIDAVSIANNHTLDYGQVGLLDTLDSARAAGFPVVGAGHNTEEAYLPLLTNVRGVRVAVVAMSQVHELSEQWKPTDTRPGIAMAFDLAKATAAVQAARKQADVVIVFMHWGVEGSSCPNAEMKNFAAKMSAAGADIMLGSHAHVLLAGGYLGSTYVHYGLGNFLWYGTSHSTDSGVLRLTVRARQVVQTEFVVGTVSSTGQPVPLTGAAEKAIRDKLATAAKCTGLAAAPTG